ncbi:hypothetical protein ACFIOY_28120 [Bradyrhizobium sp. TZ2]
MTLSILLEPFVGFVIVVCEIAKLGLQLLDKVNDGGGLAEVNANAALSNLATLNAASKATASATAAAAREGKPRIFNLLLLIPMNDPTHFTDVLAESTGSSQGSRAICHCASNAQIVNSPAAPQRLAVLRTRRFGFCL